ncbi:protein of unknown function [Taphrina deformans PYCC 5710]|uniref:Uncharacterized protein n=1 Tax=Taphrina deformans (strain PYCC 5710 / ATCC 11124 / CBS 356.35 / IMI 108563 / JCM 9778 / NBRC 8474) TaxID=1097556 RepID=R4X6G7_TAPDE|nr:protein of unknown function [Taphrina deformans PYCC 5710]|eukprot:CCG80680.1 protein of unknown function [Taphrina deformans PYCC 5710]
MDDSSQFYGIGILIKRALQLNTNLLRLLSTDLTSPPSFYGSYHFNHLLKILSTNALPSAQIFATQVLIIEQMQGRGIHLNLAGYKALLKGYAHDPAKFDMVASQMVQAGYNLSKDDSLNLDGAGYGPVGAHVKSLDELSLSLRDAKNFSELSSRIAVHRSDLSDVRVWRTVLSNYRRTHEAVDLCLHFVKSEKLTMTTYLAGLLLQACKSEASLVQVGRICQTAVSRSVPFDTFLWVEYLKRIIWSGNPGEAVSIVAVEPGGNHLLDMDPAVRRDPRVWNATLQALNQQVKQGNLAAQKHARYLGMMVKGLREFEVVYSQSLMWCILEAAIYSGSRMWAKRHSCDTIVAIFEHEVDMIGNEPWKIPGNDLLWHAYMKVLVANEETTRLSDAMRRLLGTGLSPSRRLMRTFALGLWESGNIQLLEYWRKYFEEETDLAWPESDDVFATRRALRLRYFYD